MVVRSLYIEPGSSWENGYCERFNSKFGDELLDREIFPTLREPEVLIERWRKEDNAVILHSSLSGRPLALEAILTTWIVRTRPGESFPSPGGQRTGTLT
jgi:putative transposase